MRAPDAGDTNSVGDKHLGRTPRLQKFLTAATRFSEGKAGFGIEHISSDLVQWQRAQHHGGGFSQPDGFYRGKYVSNA
ncbi:hypothetical protein AMECASPLE_006579 [Ameca splendens]|uniref:Uncharacterized protein n=1 Tax=Ameca splendens TaxID=208324 RepID=A0ABV0XCH3_9TELE